MSNASELPGNVASGPCRDDRLRTLISQLADAIAATSASPHSWTQVKARARGLSALQLRDALGHLEAAMPAKVEIAALAELAGLSQSHYSRAFKASTGLPPYQWQLQARIERAKDMLLNTNGSLEDVAEATGFADAVHFGRTFRKITGATPAAWRMERLT